jgi:hypothetical protein
MAKKSVIIQTQSELEDVWSDENCPNLSWGFIEKDLEECFRDDGTYVATYETLEVPEGETMCFTYLTNSGETTYHLQAGEYGIRPSE